MKKTIEITPDNCFAIIKQANRYYNGGKVKEILANNRVRIHEDDEGYSPLYYYSYLTSEENGRGFMDRMERLQNIYNEKLAALIQDLEEEQDKIISEANLKFEKGGK